MKKIVESSEEFTKEIINSNENFRHLKHLI